MTTDLERTILDSLEDQRVIDRMLAAGTIVRDDSNGWDRIRIPTPARWRVFINGENTGWTSTGTTPVQAAIDFLVDRGEPKYGCGDDGFTITVVTAQVRELR